VGLDLALLINLPGSGGSVLTQDGALPQATATRGSDCLTFQVSAADLNLGTLPSGDYQLQLYAGPSLSPVGQGGTVTVNSH
jgi:hypothetical protein